MNDVDGLERKPNMIGGRAHDRALAALFNEELGVVLQIRRDDRHAVMEILRKEGLGAVSHLIGTLNKEDEIRVWRNAKRIFSASRRHLQQTWSEVSYRMARRRDDPVCAQEEFDALLDVGDPGLSLSLEAVTLAAPYIASGARPRMAILREQGVNGEVEMAAAFDRAGFECADVHMSDLHAGRVRLADFKGIAACGGFSYGDVLGAGQGWAKSILFNTRLLDEFSAFFARPDSFALGVCNGCQMLSNLSSIIPGAGAWPTFSTQSVRAVRGAFHDGRDSAVTLDIFCRHGRSADPDRGVARRRSRRVFRSRRVRRRDALCGQSWPNRQHLSGQSEWFAGRTGRRDDGRWSFHGDDAASRAGVQAFTDVVAARSWRR